MIIQLDPKTRIVGTERAWELQRPRMRKGVQFWVPYKWFTSFGSALEKTVHRDIRLHPAANLSEALKACRAVTSKYARIFDAVGQRPEDAA